MKKTKRMGILLPQLPSQGKQEEGGFILLDRCNGGGVRQTWTRGSLHPMKRRASLAPHAGSHEVPPCWGQHDRHGRGYCNGWQTSVILGGDGDGNVGRVVGGDMIAASKEDNVCTQTCLILIYIFK